MTVKLVGVAAIAVLIGAGSAFAAETPATPVPAASHAPAAAVKAEAAKTAAPAAVKAEAAKTAAPAAAKAETKAAAKAMPAKADMKAAAKAMPAKAHVSACTRSIEVAEHHLKSSKAKPDVIAAAWQQIEAAKQARRDHHQAACHSAAKAAAKML